MQYVVITIHFATDIYEMHRYYIIKYSIKATNVYLNNFLFSIEIFIFLPIYTM